LLSNRVIGMGRLLAYVLMMFGVAAGASAAQVSVAVATNFTAPMREIAAAFAQASGHQAILVFGATGALYAQINNGAPFQLLLAADRATPARLEREGRGLKGSRFTYAIGQLVLWSAQPGLVDPHGEILRTGRFERLALANPKLAPYGAAAIETLTRMGQLERLKSRLVQAENITQAYQFVATGNADLGWVALSQVMADGQIKAGSAWVVPGNLHAPIRQDGVVLIGGKDQPAVAALVEFLGGDRARRIIRGYGYER